ncbi:YczE/YyaS/YitT family protein [Butyrivibrio fibrisolvens]|uniref:YczE/YyaS/YitT family protein n=1 Tax=Butyrivibrio fibrisolvens TaxID=831 RepID=UPI0003F63F4C|nr:membrane protein [Butyrivibrio fibrisolvens]
MIRYLKRKEIHDNQTIGAIILHMVIAAVSLFFNGFGIYLTIKAGIGAGPWDVLNLGISKTSGISYGNASVMVSFTILLIDIFLREPIGIAMFIDSVVVGKAVDLFDRLDLIKTCTNNASGIILMLVGLIIMGYTQYTYMVASLGCGSRDTLLVGLSKRIRKIPIGIISVALLSLATFIGYILGGPVGIGTLICAFATGPIMQLAFHTVHFDAAMVHHQSLTGSVKVLMSRIAS